MVEKVTCDLWLDLDENQAIYEEKVVTHKELYRVPAQKQAKVRILIWEKEKSDD